MAILSIKTGDAADPAVWSDGLSMNPSLRDYTIKISDTVTISTIIEPITSGRVVTIAAGGKLVVDWDFNIFAGGTLAQTGEVDVNAEVYVQGAAAAWNAGAGPLVIGNGGLLAAVSGGALTLDSTVVTLSGTGRLQAGAGGTITGTNVAATLSGASELAADGGTISLTNANGCTVVVGAGCQGYAINAGIINCRFSSIAGTVYAESGGTITHAAGIGAVGATGRVEARAAGTVNIGAALTWSGGGAYLLARDGGVVNLSASMTAFVAGSTVESRSGGLISCTALQAWRGTVRFSGGRITLAASQSHTFQSTCRMIFSRREGGLFDATGNAIINLAKCYGFSRGPAIGV